MTQRSRDDSKGAYNAKTGTFTVPKNGRYEMTLQLSTHSRNIVNNYYVSMNLDNKMFDQIQDRTRSNGGLAANLVILTTEIDAKKGQVISYVVISQYSVTSLSRSGCYLGDKQVECSYLQGKLTKTY